MRLWPRIRERVVRRTPRPVSSAVRATPVDLQCVATGRERGESGDFSDQTLQLNFEIPGELDVLDSTTALTDEVMMMTGQPLRHLISGQASRPVVWLDYACLLEDGETPVDRRDGDLSAHLLVELRGRARPVDSGQGRHHQATAGCVSSSAAGQSLFDLTIGDWRMSRILGSLADNDSHYTSNTETGQMTRGLLVIGGLTLALAACDTASSGPDDGIVIVATTSVLGDIVQSVAGDEARLEILIPIGVDAHDFSPSAQQASVISGADLVVANGLGLEAGLEDFITAAAADGVEVLEVAPLLDPIPLQSDNAILDPHFWMDPLRAGEAARVIAEALATRTGGGWEERAGAYASQLEETDVTVSELLSVIPAPGRVMVTNHESLGYFADRYEFDILGVVVPGGSTLAEPSSAHLAELVEVMDQAGANVVFAETTEAATLAEAITSELGADARVVELYTESLGEPGSEAGTLSGMLLSNARSISEALA